MEDKATGQFAFVVHEPYQSSIYFPVYGHETEPDGGEGGWCPEPAAPLHLLARQAWCVRAHIRRYVTVCVCVAPSGLGCHFIVILFSQKYTYIL